MRFCGGQCESACALVFDINVSVAGISVNVTVKTSFYTLKSQRLFIIIEAMIVGNLIPERLDN